MQNNVGKLAGLELLEELQEMWSRHPDGLTIRDIQRETGLPYHTAHAAAVWIAENRKAQWMQRPDRKAAVLVPLDWKIERWDLTGKQRRVLETIAEAADDEGCSRISYRTMAETACVPTGGIVAHVDALDRKGYLEIMSVGNSTTTGCFRAHPNGDGPKGYSPRRIHGIGARQITEPGNHS